MRKEHDLNGLDYLEVGADQRTLTVYFLGKAPVSLEPSNILIEGGQRIRDITVEKVTITRTEMAELDDFMEVVTDKEGDFSTYTLQVVDGRDELGNWKRHRDFDARYDHVEFSFKVDCPSDLDCKQEVVCPPEKLDKPEINYLAKDYASFRQLILDRLALVMPDWKERHVPDLGITLVELLAYVGDHLSYYQDAVATEAYLDTARQRISVRRHVRLVDYPIHEGCNARTWVCVKTESNLTLNPRDIYFITVLDRLDWVVKEEDVLRETTQGYEVFEPITKEPIRLYAGRHDIYFHTWGDKECCLPRGTTKATLKGDWVEVPTTQKPPGCEPEQDVKKGTEPAATEPSQKPHLKPGDVLIFEEVIGPKTGNKADADPKHRHAVRLTDVRHGHDPLSTDAITEITWAEEDALPFPLCLSAMGPPQAECEVIENISVAQGNIIPVDHGITVREDLGEVPAKETIEECDCLGGVAETVVIPDRYEPALKKTPLTFSQPIQADAPALRILTQDVRQALPQVILTGTTPNGEVSEWLVRQDLLASGNRDLHCVVEIDNDGHARLRFGDDELGQRPDAGTKFHAVYRVGNGPTGNVGADTIRHMVTRNASLSGVNINIRNPLPASGGTVSEPLAEVKLFAPHAFRKRLERAITPADYAAIALREFPNKVQRAAAQLRWNGSWYEILVAVDPLGREEADAALLKEIEGRLYRYRRIGHDLVVKSAHRVPLDIELLICVLPGYLRGHVKVELLDLFSNRLLPDGRLGFFHPDILTFGEGIYLSTLIAMAQAVPGVESVKINKLERLFEGPNGEIENGVLPLGPLEIARVENDPSVPENGRLVLDVRGGR
ncbi:MAG TPA: putative baseplate assembly protein [Patescibacteria group bacterium]|nr:putative baseplate assembly protein [Patescibacteria group bacterium]